MSKLGRNGIKYRVDWKGCLANKIDLVEDWASAIGDMYNSLSVGHMELVKFIGEHFLEYESFSTFNDVCRKFYKTENHMEKKPANKGKFINIDGKFYVI